MQIYYWKGRSSCLKVAVTAKLSQKKHLNGTKTRLFGRTLNAREHESLFEDVTCFLPYKGSLITAKFPHCFPYLFVFLCRSGNVGSGRLRVCSGPSGPTRRVRSLFDSIQNLLMFIYLLPSPPVATLYRHPLLLHRTVTRCCYMEPSPLVTTLYRHPLLLHRTITHCC